MTYSPFFRGPTRAFSRVEEFKTHHAAHARIQMTISTQSSSATARLRPASPHAPPSG